MCLGNDKSNNFFIYICTLQITVIIIILLEHNVENNNSIRMTINDKNKISLPS